MKISSIWVSTSFFEKIGFFKNLGSKLKFGLKKTIKIAIPFTVLRIGKKQNDQIVIFLKNLLKKI